MRMQQSLTTRRNFLRLAAAAAVTVPGVSALAACSDGSSNGTSKPSGTATSAGAELSELVVPVNESPWLNAYKAVVSEYQKQSGVKVTLRTFPYAGLQTAMVNAIRGGTFDFDVYHLDEPWTGQFYANDWCIPFTDIDSSYTIDPEILTYHDLPRWDATTKQSSPDGAVMALPINGNVNLFLYRKDLYDDLNLTIPTTWDEAYSNGQKGKQSGKAKFGYVARAQATTGGQSITYDFMPLLYSFGGGWYNSQWKAMIGDAGSVAAMDEFRKLLSLGPEKPQTVSQNVVISTMQGGQALQCHTVAAAASNIEDPNQSAVAGKIGYVVVPRGSETKPTPASGVWSMAIPKSISEARQKAAFEFIKWVNSKDAQLVFMKAGGIPTREDAYDTSVMSERAKLYLPAVLESAKIARPSVRYPFSAKMLPVAEEQLATIASGSSSADAAMKSLSNDLQQIAVKAGFGKA